MHGQQNIKSESRVVPRGRSDRHTYMTKLIISSPNFARSA